MFKELKSAVLVTLIFTGLTGIAYPLAVTALAQAFFHKEAKGSLIVRNGKMIGSELIGQKFARPEYFHSRPSAAGSGYDAAASAGSNLGPSNPVLVARLEKDGNTFHEENPTFRDAIPADAITASGSGLDPDISPANARAQTARVAMARGVAASEIQRMLDRAITGRDFGVLGEPRVNVLLLNLALDDHVPVKRP